MPFFRKKPTPASTPVVVRPSAPTTSSDARERRVFELGSDMLARAKNHATGVLSAKFYSDALMEWSMKDPQFKVQMFRFVDAFPMLKTPEAIHEHLDDYLSQPGVSVPPAIAAALKAGKLAKSASSAVISSQIKGMAGKFIAGVDAASALPGLRELWGAGIASSVDLLGETCVSDEEADHYAAKYLDLVTNLPAAMAGWSPNARLESDHLGAIPRCNVSIKISALSARVSPLDPQGSIKDLMKRLVPILETARDRGVFVNFDMEHHDLKELTIQLFQQCVLAVDFRAGLAMQAYLRSGVEDAQKMCAWAIANKKRISVRLVKGAYWDAETIKAEMMGWPSPVWAQKWQTDACFEKMTEVFLDACPRKSGEPGVTLALGSHNVRSIAAALAGLEARSLPRSAIELQMLHGMADQLKHASAEMDLRMREYVPVGEMIPGMAYLVRRLLENTSNESWLKAGFLDNADVGLLLRAPAPSAGPGAVVASATGSPAAVQAAPAATDLLDIARERHALTPAVPNVGNGRAFLNEPFRDFADKRQREAFATAIARATVPKPPQDRSAEEARAMLGRAHQAFPAWRDLSPRVRAALLTKAADLMRQQRDGLAGVMIREAGKTWKEADADVCEAIDFCEYYARLAVPLFEPARIGRYIGELDEVWYQPRGASVIIAPWNFPLAILAGMTVAALVTGNTVVIKPAEQTPGIASILVDILHQAASQAGIPSALARDAIAFCPGRGEVVGAALVRDSRTALVAFTGSKAVGLDIVQAASVTLPEQEHVKKVIAEMGGKNAIIVDTSADFDEAVLAVRHSAFGFQGQKCSACSRCIVVDEQGENGPAFTTFRKRLVEATKALAIGDPLHPGTDVAPVIDREAAAKIRGFVERARASGLSCSALELPMADPFVAANADRYVAPHIFWTVAPSHELAREEIFGPVLALMHAESFEQALKIANDLPYKLTGGVFSRKPAHIDRAKREFRVGNLYINRGITGALVARQPFGGFGMSGVGSKAGGADYLLQFVEPRASCENTMRRGFAPEL